MVGLRVAFPELGEAAFPELGEAAFPELGESEVKMGNKVKIFRADKINDLEFHINSFLSNDNIGLIDLKFINYAGGSNVYDSFAVLLVYRER